MDTGMMRADTTWQSERAPAGDPAAFEALLRRYERPLYGYIARMLRDSPDDAADVLQETFLKFFRALDRVPPDANLTAWLYRVAHNACLDELRRRKRRQLLAWDGVHVTPLIAPPTENDPEAAVLRRERADVVTAVLARMSRRHREALLLREWEGLSCDEIGVVFGISRKAVKSMLFRAREEFRRVLQTPGSVAGVAAGAARGA
jgi:RNA polymerase sigma-70 factor (ECF subfamily)